MITSIDVLEDVASIFNTSVDELKTKSRYDELIFTRKIFIYVCKQKLTTSLCQLSRDINRDKTFSGKELKMINRHINNKELKWKEYWDKYVNNSEVWAELNYKK